MTTAFSCTGGSLHVHDAVGTLHVLEHGMRVSTNPAVRRHILTTASAITQWRYGAADPLLVQPNEVALLEQFTMATAMRAIEANDHDFVALLGAYLGFGDLRRRDAMAAMLYEPLMKPFLKLLRSPQPARRLRCAVQRELRNLERVDCEVDERDRLEITEKIVVEPALEMSGIDTDGYLVALSAAGAPPQAVDDIEAFLSGIPKSVLGNNRYQRAMYWLRQSREMADGLRAPNRHGTSTWYRTIPGQPDSVWHTSNRSLISPGVNVKEK